MRDDEFLALQAAKREKKAAKKRKAAGNDGAGALPAPAKLAQPQPAWEDGEWVDPPTQPASEDGEWAAASSSNATPNRSTVDRTSSSTGTDSGSGAITGTLQDKELACIDCGQTFTFTAGEQQWFLEKGYAGGKTRHYQLVGPMGLCYHRLSNIGRLGLCCLAAWPSHDSTRACGPQHFEPMVGDLGAVEQLD